MIVVRIFANDQYSISSDDLVVRVWNFSLFYAFFTLAEYGAPLIAIFGIYALRYKMYGMFCRSRYLYSREHIEVDQLFQKKIVLLYDNLNKAQKMFSWIDLTRIENYFWTPYGDLDKQKLIELVSEECLDRKMEI